MSEAIQSQGVTLSWNGVAIGELQDFSVSEAMSTIDVTHLMSTIQEIKPDLEQAPQITLSVNLVPDDTVQVALRADMKAKTEREAVITLTDDSATTLTFNAYCIGFDSSGSKGSQVTANITLQRTSTIAWA